MRVKSFSRLARCKTAWLQLTKLSQEKFDRLYLELIFLSGLSDIMVYHHNQQIAGAKMAFLCWNLDFARGQLYGAISTTRDQKELKVFYS